MQDLVVPLVVAGVVLAVLLASGVRIAQEYVRAVVFRLGRVQDVRGPGLFLLVPFIDRAVMIDMRVMTRELETQETVTRDGVAVRVNAVLWYRAVDPKQVTVAVVDWRVAVTQAAETTLRDTIGQNDLDGLLKHRDVVNLRLLERLRAAVSPWGLAVDAVELKDLDIPEQMQRAIAREAEAMRERRARVIKAEGELEASAKLSEAARAIAATPGAMELRRLQTISEVGAENNSTTILVIPGEFVAAARALAGG